MMWLRAHAEAIEGLQAEEAFRSAEIVAVGGGNLNERERDKILHRWNRAMDNNSTIRITKKDIGLVAGMGLGVRLVK
jgi:hypothetical protein